MFREALPDLGRRAPAASVAPVSDLERRAEALSAQPPLQRPVLLI